jgi:predicted amidohydrolase
MKVAAVQFCPKFKEKEENLRRLAGLIVAASKAGAVVVVLPELCTTGYSFMSVAEALTEAELAAPGGRTFDVMQALSRRFNINISWGMVERDAGTGDLYNSQVLITTHDGHIGYRKINKWGNDFLWAKAGRASPPILRTSFGRGPKQAPSLFDKFIERRLGLLICRDVRDKSLNIADFYEKGDADMVLMGANWGKGGFPAVAWMDFASSNNTSLIVANRWGIESHNDFGFGGSCIIHPDGKVDTNGLVMGQDCIVTGDMV